MDTVDATAPTIPVPTGPAYQGVQLEIATPAGLHYPALEPDACGDLAGGSDNLEVRMTFQAHASALDCQRVCLVITNNHAESIRMNVKWRLTLSDQRPPSRWLVPGLIYRDAEQQYEGGHPSLAGEPSIEGLRSRWWVLRSDLTAVPMVMAWTTEASVAMVISERVAGHMTSIGLDSRPGNVALIGAWPYREEPTPRDPATGVGPVITWAAVGPWATCEIEFLVYTASRSPHAYAPVLRETFSRWNGLHPQRARYPLTDGARAAARGLMDWHYDRTDGMLWETAAYEPHFGKNGQSIDRFEMHTAFVSGIPCAYAMLLHGLRHDPDLVNAARTVIDQCCANLSPFGTFWSSYRKGFGWGGGWPSPQRSRGIVGTDNRHVGDLQARTLAEATLFAARAAKLDSDAPSRSIWVAAVVSNLDYVLSVQRDDGNCGQAYCLRTGAVLDEDGEEGLLWIAAFVEGFRLLGDRRYLHAARAAGSYYLRAVQDAHLTGAPEAMHLLPTSEDPQNAVISYVMLHEATGEQCWLDAAVMSFDLFMTFRWQYNTEFDPDSLLGAYDFRTKGLDVSSPNNVHLHPFGLIAVPESLRLWQLTADPYVLLQTHNNIVACAQTLSWKDGVWNGRTGMSTERWAQTPGGMPKGMMMPLAHSWTTGLILYSASCLAQTGQTFLHEDEDLLVTCEPVRVTQRGAGWFLENTCSEEIDLLIRTCRRTVGLVAGAQLVSAAPSQPGTVSLPPHGSVELRQQEG